MARQLDMKIGVADSASPLALTQPVTGEIGGFKITLGPRDADLSVGGFGPGVALDGGYYRLDLVDETTATAGYTEAAVAFRAAAPNYLRHPTERLVAPGTAEEFAFFLSFSPLDMTRRQLFAATGSTNLIETLDRVVVTVPQTDASGNFVKNLKHNTNRNMLDAGLSQRRNTVAYSVRVLDATSQVVKMYSHIEGESGWTQDVDAVVDRYFFGGASDDSYPGWTFGGRFNAAGNGERFTNADVYGFALMMGAAGSVPDFASDAVRGNFFDVASGTMNNRNLDTALSPYSSSVLFSQHGADQDETSGGLLSDATVFNLPANV